MFNFEGSVLNNRLYNGRFKPNYPLLLPKFTIKLSIKAGREFSSRLGDTMIVSDTGWEKERKRNPEAAFS